MNVCEMSKKSLLNCEVDSSIIGIDGHQENGPGDNIYQVNLMKDVKKYYTTPLEEEVMDDDDDKMTTATSNDYSNHQGDRLANVADEKMINEDESVKTWSKLKADSGSASGGEHDQCNQDDTTDVLGKKRKTRRGKPKRRKLKPYTKQNLTFLPRQLSRKNSNKQIKKLPPQPPAPYNTTQFLIEDHNDLPDLEQKLSTTNTSDIHELFQKPNPPPRTRDSSFSIDSDYDYFYSSPEDEEEFLTKEFSSAYEDLHAERLSSLSKNELIQEYVQLEAKIELITKGTKNIDTKLSTTTTTTTNIDDVIKKLKYYQQKVDDLSKQNDQLKRDNEALRRKRNNSVSSVDSESDSDSSSSSSSNCTSISGNIDGCNERISVDSDSTSSKEEESLTNGHSKNNNAGQRVADVTT